MMRFGALTLLASALVLAGCGRSSTQLAMKQPETPAMYDVAEPPPAPTVAEPQIAYAYALTYRLADGRVAAVQARQVALCTRLGPARCRVVKTALENGSDGAPTTGETSLLLDARIASPFLQRLDAVASDAGGAVADRSTTSEDVTKQIVDTDARVRAKQALADRLLKLISTANGKVGDLVAAEQAYAGTQEELDAARSLQATLRRRVAMSQIDIAYTATSATGAWAPVQRSIGDVGQALGTSIAALVTFFVVALPWLLAGGLLLWALRRAGLLRWPFRRRHASTPHQGENVANAPILP